MDDDAGHGHLLGVALEAANTVLLTYALSEVLLRGSCLWDLRYAGGSLGLLNLALSPRLHACFVATGLFGAPGSSLEGAANSGVGAGSSASALAAPATPAGSATTWVAPLTAAAASPVTRGLLRLLAVLGGFALLAYKDVGRLRQQPYTLSAFMKELRGALRLVLPVFPFLVMGFSCALMVLTAVLGKVGLPQELGEELIFYGQFYAPLSAVYWIMKKDWLAHGGEPPLPLHGGGVAAATRGGSGRCVRPD